MSFSFSFTRVARTDCSRARAPSIRCNAAREQKAGPGHDRSGPPTNQGSAPYRSSVVELQFQ